MVTPAGRKTPAPTEVVSRAEGILLTVAYDGGPFSGFVPQPGQRTIAGELLRAIRTMRPDVAEVRGASRTDAGVHARGQRVAFDADGVIPPRGWVLGLAAHLPEEIAVRAASRVDPGYTPRFRSRGKRYVYSILCDPVRDPFVERVAVRVPVTLDRERLATEARAAVGTHDFAAFRGARDERDVTVRTVRRFDVLEDLADPRLLRLVVEGDGFLYHMVRILAGTLLDVGLGRVPEGAIARGIELRDRHVLGRTAPPEGLALDEVFLDDAGREAWPSPERSPFS